MKTSSPIWFTVIYSIPHIFSSCLDIILFLVLTLTRQDVDTAIQCMGNLVCSCDSASEGVCPTIPSIFVTGATVASRGNYIFHVNWLMTPLFVV